MDWMISYQNRKVFVYCPFCSAKVLKPHKQHAFYCPDCGLVFYINVATAVVAMIRDRQGRLPTGKAVITTGGRLKAKHVVHTVGPVWHGGEKGEPDLLSSAYFESLKLAADNGLKSISFPSISTGIYGYPVDPAAKVALATVIDFLEQDSRLDEVVFVLYDSATYRAYEHALRELSPER